MEKISLNKLSEITNMSTNTLRQFLGGYRFAKFRLAHDYKYTNEFVQILIDFLELKNKYKAIENLKQYVTNFNKPEI